MTNYTRLQGNIFSNRFLGTQLSLPYRLDERQNSQFQLQFIFAITSLCFQNESKSMYSEMAAMCLS